MSEREIDYSGYYWQNELVRLRASRTDDPEVELPARLFNSQSRFFSEGEVELPWDEHRWRETWENYVNANRSGSNRVIVEVDNLDGVRVGGGNLHGIDERSGTFGLFISVLPGYEGMGYDLAAGRLLLDYAFNERRLHKCHACVIVGDTAGAAFYEGLGFKKECVLRAMVYHQGRYWDEARYGLLAEEFNAARGIGG